MSARYFLDTNLLIYAHGQNAGEKSRKARALIERLWQDRSGVLSTQVLQEFYVNICRNTQRPPRRGEARRLVTDYMSWELIVNDGDSILGALEIERRYRLSFWDALIVQAANQAAAAALYSEDLSHGQTYGMVEVINPLLD
jgi:predicted nucleic acid-binding protein